MSIFLGRAKVGWSGQLALLCSGPREQRACPRLEAGLQSGVFTFQAPLVVARVQYDITSARAPAFEAYGCGPASQHPRLPFFLATSALSPSQFQSLNLI